MNLPLDYTLSGCRLNNSGVVKISGIPEGFDAFWLAKIAADSASEAHLPIIHIARDDARLQMLSDGISFFAPNIKQIIFPAWDCIPFDRVSPRVDIVSRRLKALSEILEFDSDNPTIVLTTVNAVTQRIPPRKVFKGACEVIALGDKREQESLVLFLEKSGFVRSGNAMEVGEYALRGGILDIFPASAENPIRLEFFGNEIDKLRTFDPITQRSIEEISDFSIGPVGEVTLNPESILQFKTGYRVTFGAVMDSDPLFESISAGHRYPGVEHWLPLFHDRLDSFFDYLPQGLIVFDHLADQALSDRHESITDYYDARIKGQFLGASREKTNYKALPPELLYIDKKEWEELLSDRPVAHLTQFESSIGSKSEMVSLEAQIGRDFSAERKRGHDNLYEELSKYLAKCSRKGGQILIAAWSLGTRDRLQRLIEENKIAEVAQVNEWTASISLPKGVVGIIVLPLERGFEAEGLTIVAEQDILGRRLNRGVRKKIIRAKNFIADTSEIKEGDYVVHLEHGIACYKGLTNVDVGGAPHDCLSLFYEGGDKLLLPVEHIDLLSRYGSSDRAVSLDRLGGAGWQARKAKLKQRVREMASALIATAAKRQLQEAPVFSFDGAAYNAFCAGFPYVETEDQNRAINETLLDLQSGNPMDRLICGDVGFGKTEVALRAAFAAVMSGKQVVVLVPTTLLSRQHFETFFTRFKEFPVKVAELSRLVNTKVAKQVRDNLISGDIDIVIGTHAILSKDMQLNNLGLVIIDEEQHFGVAHKERLKKLKTEIHVLTLTATPIPRTLQMALSGVRGMSIMATPPVDRLAVRTFILPYDTVVIREAILREKMRGGQTFYVCPRVSDLRKVQEQLKALIPEVRVESAHGQMSTKELENTMVRFFDGEFDVLVSTAIIESGLDVPRVNTMVVHRADMFGLAQLYQLRGRIGRSNLRGYAYITFSPTHRVTDKAYKRLEAIHRLDSLGAGFSLASYDLDIRGAGNLLGSEQSGHIREVGVELYQHMLEEAVAEAKAETSTDADEIDDHWSPQINIGTAVLIPDNYVTDLDTRLGLYRRVASLENKENIEDLIEELTDRFGSPPDSVLHLLEIVLIKNLCRNAGVSKIDAGPKGAVFSFHNDSFTAIPELLSYVANPEKGMRLRPDSRLILTRNWARSSDRLNGVKRILLDLRGLLKEDEKSY